MIIDTRSYFSNLILYIDIMIRSHLSFIYYTILYEFCLSFVNVMIEKRAEKQGHNQSISIICLLIQ
jgi:hypothetical protein